MTEQVVLFGAGTVGRFLCRELTAKGTSPIRFADNDPGKWDMKIDGIRVASPDECKREFPSATWVPTVLHTPYPAEIIEQIRQMQVKSEPLTNYLSTKRNPLDETVTRKVLDLCADQESIDEMWDQFYFRLHGDKWSERGHYDVKDVYFPDFVQKLDEEVFVDCGAADGDTAIEVLKRWEKPTVISFEPDPINYDAYQARDLKTILFWGAVSDFNGKMAFTSTGDQTAHLGGEGREVPVFTLDSAVKIPPTFIKMDIEGSELEGLWGARRLIAKHSPVLAICAYHTDDHIWQIPLLIHALNPTYKLFLRRYLEQPWEMIWYAVPPERVRSYRE